MLNYNQLQNAVAAAKRQFALLREKYPALDRKDSRNLMTDLKAYLVLSLPTGQVWIDASPKDILSKFPAMVIDDGTKTKALAILSRLQTLEWTTQESAETDQLMKQWEQLAPLLNYDENCQVEIRFKDNSYDLIGKLQEDDLVNRNLTPQTKASIRIVLGTLSKFGQQHD